jgi:hypothetical protein
MTHPRTVVLGYEAVCVTHATILYVYKDWVMLLEVNRSEHGPLKWLTDELGS